MTAFVAAGVTHAGLRRSGNEDSGYVGRRLLVVADGMGGVEYGEVASAIATHAVTYLDDCVSPQGVAHDLAAAVEFAEYRLARAAERDPGRAGMGTTMTALLLHDDVVALVHVGDSRAYRLRDGVLEQVTRDHTFVQLLVELGELTPEAAEHHPQRHVLVKALQGSGDAVTADVQVRPATPGDRFLLCSDGLSDYVERHPIARALTLPDPAAAAAALVELALAAGAPDNVTCVVADVVPGRHVPGAGEPVLLGAAAELDARGYRPAGSPESLHRAT
jgi:protein phosphatase